MAIRTAMLLSMVVLLLGGCLQSESEPDPGELGGLIAPRIGDTYVYQGAQYGPDGAQVNQERITLRFVNPNTTIPSHLSLQCKVGLVFRESNQGETSMSCHPFSKDAGVKEVSSGPLHGSQAFIVGYSLIPPLDRPWWDAVLIPSASQVWSQSGFNDPSPTFRRTPDPYASYVTTDPDTGGDTRRVVGEIRDKRSGAIPYSWTARYRPDRPLPVNLSLDASNLTRPEWEDTDLVSGSAEYSLQKFSRGNGRLINAFGMHQGTLGVPADSKSRPPNESLSGWLESLRDAELHTDYAAETAWSFARSQDRRLNTFLNRTSKVRPHSVTYRSISALNGSSFAYEWNFSLCGPDRKCHGSVIGRRVHPNGSSYEYLGTPNQSDDPRGAFRAELGGPVNLGASFPDSNVLNHSIDRFKQLNNNVTVRKIQIALQASQSDNGTSSSPSSSSWMIRLSQGFIDRLLRSNSSEHGIRKTLTFSVYDGKNGAPLLESAFVEPQPRKWFRSGPMQEE